MLIENLGKAGKSPEKKVSIICVPTLLSPQFFFFVNVAINYHGSLSPVAFSRDGALAQTEATLLWCMVNQMGCQWEAEGM